MENFVQGNMDSAGLTFGHWLAAVYYIICSETGLCPSQVRVDETAARGYYDDGCTPLVFYNEVWEDQYVAQENNSLCFIVTDGIETRQYGPFTSKSQVQQAFGPLVSFLTESETGHASFELINADVCILRIDIARLISMERLMQLIINIAKTD